MKATQIRAFLVAPALLAAFGLSAHLASGDTVTPSGTFTAALCSGSHVTITLGSGFGATTVTCNTSATGGTVPAPTGAGHAVCGAVDAPTLLNCTARVSIFSFAANCTAAGDWNLCVTPTTSTLTGGTVNCTAHVNNQNCTANSGAVTLNGSWSNSTSSAAFSNQTVNVTTSGGFPCPSASTAKFSATYCTNPSLTVTDP